MVLNSAMGKEKGSGMVLMARILQSVMLSAKRAASIWLCTRTYFICFYVTEKKLKKLLPGFYFFYFFFGGGDCKHLHVYVLHLHWRRHMGKDYYTIVIYWQNLPMIKISFSSHHSWYQKSAPPTDKSIYSLVIITSFLLH